MRYLKVSHRGDRRPGRESEGARISNARAGAHKHPHSKAMHDRPSPSGIFNAARRLGFRPYLRNGVRVRRQSAPVRCGPAPPKGQLRSSRDEELAELLRCVIVSSRPGRKSQAPEAERKSSREPEEANEEQRTDSWKPPIDRKNDARDSHSDRNVIQRGLRPSH